jgi:hypothetical protein
MTRLSTAVTAGPVTTTRTKSVLALTPLTVAVIACEGGVASLGLAAEKLRLAGETTNCGGDPPPPPPPPLQAAMTHTTNAAHAARAIPQTLVMHRPPQGKTGESISVRFGIRFTQNWTSYDDRICSAPLGTFVTGKLL